MPHPMRYSSRPRPLASGAPVLQFASAADRRASDQREVAREQRRRSIERAIWDGVRRDDR